MNTRLANTAKLCVMLLAILLAGIGLLYVFDVFEGEQAQSLATKALWACAILCAAGLAVVVVAGRGPKASEDH